MFMSLLNSVPDSIEVGTEGMDWCTIVPIARCEETGRVVSVDCALAPTHHGFQRPSSAHFHEFSFAISCADLMTGEVFFTQDRAIAQNYIPRDVRSFVMPVVLASCSALIAEVRPGCIFRVTKIRHPTDAALAKHHRLTRHIMALGYALREQGVDGYGRSFWLLERNEVNHI